MLSKTNLVNKDFILNYFPKYSKGVEIGVWMGDFSKKILEIIKPTQLYLNDPWEFIPSKPGSWYGGNWATNQSDMNEIYFNVFKYFNVYNNVKIIKDYSSNLHKYIPSKSLDWTYIDGNHDYEFVLNDLIISKDLIKDTGLIIGDDFYNGNDIHKALLQFTEDNPEYNFEIISNQFILKK